MASGRVNTQTGPGHLPPEAVDRYVCRKIRERRIQLGLTHQQIAELIGVTCPQAHKYEAGISRISAGRLFALAQALGVEVNYFVDGLNDPRSFESMPHYSALLELTRDFISMPATHQKAISRFAREMVEPKLALIYEIDDGQRGNVGPADISRPAGAPEA